MDDREKLLSITE